jgi:hypothetical protein
MSLSDITTAAMRGAFAQFAEAHDAASIQRCWSTWNVLCTFKAVTHDNALATWGDEMFADTVTAAR